MKPGPKLKPGQRYDSGRLKPENKRDAGLPPILVQRLQRVAEDSKWGSVLGVMYLNEHITSPEMRAGMAYARLRGAHDGVMGYQRRSTQAMAFSEAARGPGVDLDPDAILALRERHADLLEMARGSRPLLDRACVEDQEIRPADIMRLRVALQGMVQFFGIERV